MCDLATATRLPMQEYPHGQLIKSQSLRSVSACRPQIERKNPAPGQEKTPTGGAGCRQGPIGFRNAGDGGGTLSQKADFYKFFQLVLPFRQRVCENAMVARINRPGVSEKFCTSCTALLVPGKTWRQSDVKRRKYQCRLCRSRAKNKRRKTSGGRRWRLGTQALYEKQGGRCALTGRPIDRSNMHLDHRVPRAKGGPGTLDNLQWLHKDVNAMKHALSQDEFIALCEEVVLYHILGKSK